MNSTIRDRQLAYVVYVCMPTFIGIRMILDMRMLTRTLIFKFSKVSYNFTLFKNLLLYN